MEQKGKGKRHESYEMDPIFEMQSSQVISHPHYTLRRDDSPYVPTQSASVQQMPIYRGISHSVYDGQFNEQPPPSVQTTQNGKHYQPPKQPQQSHSKKRMLQSSSSIRVLTESFIGVAPNTSSVKRRVPEGYKIKHSKSGLTYLESSTKENDEWLAASLEHARSRISLLCSKEELGDRFGVGIYLYFDFVRFLTLTNFLLLILALISTVAHFVLDGLQLSAEPSRKDLANFHRNFYISYYTLESRKYWFWTTVAAMALWFLFGPLYARRVTSYFKQRNAIDYQNSYEDEDIIEENRFVSKKSRGIRFVLSYLITLGLLCVSGGGTFALVIASENSLGNIRASAAVSLLFLAVHALWRLICTYLTKLERHRTWTTYRKHNTFKFYIFKMINVVLMYVLRFIIRTRYRDTFSYDVNIPLFEKIEPTDDPCGINEVGDQFLILILAEMTLGNIANLVWPWLLWIVMKKRAELSNHSNNASRPEFDVAENYLDLFYRQFVVYMGMTVFPLITFIGLISYLIQFPLDKLRLLRIMREPYRQEGSMKAFVVFFLFCTALIAFASFPHGGIWVLLGFSFKDQCYPSVYNGARDP